MKTKEEIIKEAWGEYYNHGVGIDNNGWLSENYLTNDQCKLLNTYERVEYINELGYRPKSLQGIENNNGWIKIESETDLPKEEGMYHVYYSDSTISSRYFHREYNDWTDYPKATHYQPINKPNKPIY